MKPDTLFYRLFKQWPDLLAGKIGAPPIDKLEELAEALLEFNRLEDLQQWLDEKS